MPNPASAAKYGITEEDIHTWMRGILGVLGPACRVRAPPVDTTSSMVYLITMVSLTRYPLLRFSSTDRFTNLR